MAGIATAEFRGAIAAAKPALLILSFLGRFLQASAMPSLDFTMEQHLSGLVNKYLSLMAYQTATFLAERLCASFPSEVQRILCIHSFDAYMQCIHTFYTFHARIPCIHSVRAYVPRTHTRTHERAQCKISSLKCLLSCPSQNPAFFASPHPQSRPLKVADPVIPRLTHSLDPQRSQPMPGSQPQHVEPAIGIAFAGDCAADAQMHSGFTDARHRGSSDESLSLSRKPPAPMRLRLSLVTRLPLCLNAPVPALRLRLHLRSPCAVLQTNVQLLATCYLHCKKPLLARHVLKGELQPGSKVRCSAVR